jgi:hypothetical protein
MISTERCNKGPRVAILMHEGDRIGTDRTNEGNKNEQWVIMSVGPMPSFDPQQEKETYQREMKEVLREDWGASTSMTPHEEYRAMPEKPMGKVSMLT